MMKTTFKVLQVNMHHCKAASAALHRYVINNEIDIVLIQEPWVFKGRIRGLRLTRDWEILSPVDSHPRACIAAKKRLNLLPMWGFCSRDLSVAKMVANLEGSERDLVVGSAYLPYDQPDLPPTKEVRELVKDCESKNIQLMLGCDSNAHHLVWGSTGTNRRGECLLEFIISSRLEVANCGNEPTFVTSVRREVIDITMASPIVNRAIHGWHVSSEPSLSDHRYIRFNIETPKVEPGTYRNPKTCNWELYKHTLKQELDQCPRRPQTPAAVELMNDFVSTAIIKAYEHSCPLRERREDRRVPWWNRELSSLRTEVRRLFNRAKRTGEWEDYKSLRLKYGYALRKAKDNSWRKYCEEIESTPECARLQKALTRENQGKIGSLLNTEGKYTASERETLELLLKTHFPGGEILTEHCPEDSPNYDIPIVRAKKEDWNLGDRLITKTSLAWAINSFKPYKAAGADGIFPALLKQGLETLSTPLCAIFRASIALGYVPTSWRVGRVVFIPKPGRDTYAKAKSFRPISLTSFLMKTLEKLIDRHIRDEVLRDTPLHRNQHAYQSGKSCELAIHELTNRIENALNSKEIALGAFLDIEGAFDNTSFDSIKRAVEERGVSRPVTNWIDSALRNRKIITSIGRVDGRASVARGCPQGGVLSPLLWCLVLDDLLRTLEQMGIYAQGYADDLTILISGKFGGTVSDLMQRALKTVESWCSKEGLSVNPAKTTIIPFTKKRNLDLRELNLWGQTLQLEQRVKYLGVVLDSKLTFDSHLEKVTTKATRALWACRSMVGKKWGLKPYMMRWLYTKVVRPTITYASLIWWHKTNRAGFISKLSKLQRLACLGITGAMITTPTAAMEMLLDLPPLHLVMRAEALGAAYRLNINAIGLRSGNRKIGGHNEIFNQLENTRILSMPSDRISKVFDFRKPFRVVIPERVEEERILKLREQRRTIWYTDGSKTSSSTGAGIYEETGNGYSINLGNTTTVFQAELLAITACVQVMVWRGYENRMIHIMTDSKAALQALNSVEIYSRTVLNCLNALVELALRNRITLEWVPGHQGIAGNDKADSLAKEGSSKSLVGPEPTCGISYRTARKAIRETLQEQHLAHWMSLPGLRQSRMFIGDSFNARVEELLKLSRNQIRLATGIITGHISLRKHLHTIGAEDDPTCRMCLEEDETPQHLLCECLVLANKRHLHFGMPFPKPEEIALATLDRLLNFFRDTGLLG